MYEQLNSQLNDAKEQLARHVQLKASLAPARERLTAEAHRVQRIENCLAEVERRIQSLESFTLQSLISSVTWKKEGELDHLRSERARLSPQIESGERSLLELEAAVREIESEMTSLNHAEEFYKSICNQKHEQILADNGEPAAPLHEIAAQLSTAKHERQLLRRSTSIAKSLIDRLRSMTKASGRAKKKMIHGGGIGALASAAINTAHQKAAGGAVDRAREGLREFVRSIETLGIVSTSERDAELVRLGTVLAHSIADVGGGTRSPLIDVIHQAIGLIQTKLEETESVVASLEAQRIELVENA